MSMQTNDRIIITGITGSGKTIFAKYLINLFAQKIQIAIYDHKRDEYNRGFISTIPEALSEVQNKIFVYKPKAPTIPALEQLCKTVLEKRNCVLVVEEADMYARRYPSRIPPNLYRIYQEGRSEGIGSISITRRPQNLHPDCLSQAQHIIAFHQHFPRDVEYLAKWIGEKAYRLSPLVCEEKGLTPLPPFCYLHYQDRGAVTTIHTPIMFTGI